MDKSDEGPIIVYTGPGKGKTTAALGLALRACGHGFPVYLGQFLKGRPSGELQAAQSLPRFTVEQFGTERFVDLERPTPQDVSAAEDGLRACAAALAGGSYRVVIMDEANVAAGHGLLQPERVLAAVEARAPGVTAVLTGRDAPEVFLAAADLVTVMQEVKHPYRSGTPARPGIEY